MQEFERPADAVADRMSQAERKAGGPRLRVRELAASRTRSVTAPAKIGVCASGADSTARAAGSAGTQQMPQQAEGECELCFPDWLEDDPASSCVPAPWLQSKPNATGSSSATTEAPPASSAAAGKPVKPEAQSAGSSSARNSNASAANCAAKLRHRLRSTPPINPYALHALSFFLAQSFDRLRPHDRGIASTAASAEGQQFQNLTHLDTADCNQRLHKTNDSAYRRQAECQVIDAP
jgi:hypothetical protein